MELKEKWNMGYKSILGKFKLGLLPPRNLEIPRLMEAHVDVHPCLTQMTSKFSIKIILNLQVLPYKLPTFHRSLILLVVSCTDSPPRGSTRRLC